MNATVPEEKRQVIPFDDEELMSLAVRLAGNKAFGLCRNKFNERFSYLAERIVNDTNSPTEAMAQFDELVGAMRVMTKLLAKLKRDRKIRAREELECALADSNYMIAGESLPLESTLPVTILMLEPEMTLRLLAWILDDSSPFAGIIDILPGLTRLSNRDDILNAYQKALTGLTTAFDGSIKLSNDTWREFHGEFNEKQDADTVVYFGIFPLAYMFFGKDQAQILALVGRDNSSRVATWQINVPRFMLGWSPHFSIGFHEEISHDTWIKRYPSFASRGVSHGYGTFFLMEPIMNHDARVDYNNRQMVRVDKSDSTYLREIVQKKDASVRIELSPFDPKEVRFKF